MHSMFLQAISDDQDLGDSIIKFACVHAAIRSDSTVLQRDLMVGT